MAAYCEALRGGPESFTLSQKNLTIRSQDDRNIEHKYETRKHTSGKKGSALMIVGSCCMNSSMLQL